MTPNFKSESGVSNPNERIKRSDSTNRKVEGNF